jgi:hypothetical protein
MLDKTEDQFRRPDTRLLHTHAVALTKACRLFWSLVKNVPPAIDAMNISVPNSNEVRQGTYHLGIVSVVYHSFSATQQLGRPHPIWCRSSHTPKIVAQVTESCRYHTSLQRVKQIGRIICETTINCRPEIEKTYIAYIVLSI